MIFVLFVHLVMFCRGLNVSNVGEIVRDVLHQTQVCAPVAMMGSI